MPVFCMTRIYPTQVGGVGCERKGNWWIED
jgi:hypothetical protein